MYVLKCLDLFDNMNASISTNLSIWRDHGINNTAMEPGDQLSLAYKGWMEGETASLALSKRKKNKSTITSKAH